MTAGFEHAAVELREVAAERLGDAAALSALAVAAAGAIGMPPHAPPLVKQATGSLVVALLCREGHVVLHAAPGDGVCLVDIVARAPAAPRKGLEVITRRLAGHARQ
ncbi:MAG TPA: S-adenosylmethionine decarboxylase [Gemmatimonadales bacterium]|nr:S-adenosylmethionine decarboxylase [Gemmatimonadales bacterium]